MKYNPEIHHRRSIRLKEYDSNTGAYYVTICAQNRECLFGGVWNCEIRLNEFGEIVKKEWLQTSDIRNNIKLDEYVIMPNHFHGIIILNDYVGATRRVAHVIEGRDIHNTAIQNTIIPNRAIHRIAPTTLKSNSIGSIIGQFKSLVTKQINQIRNTPRFPVWQRNYFERVIRNEYELKRVREYIINNPHRWDEDEYNPDNLQGRHLCLS